MKGRDQELETLADGFDRCASGETVTFLIRGAPGIGKTTLAAAGARLAEGRGGLVTWGRCWEGGGAPAYWPWTQVLREVLEEDEALLARLGSGGRAIARLLPELEEEEPGGDPEAERFALFDQVTRLLEMRAKTAPVTVILDDLHASDHASLLLLKFIARTSRRGRLLIVGTYRTHEVAADAELTTAVNEIARDATTLALGPLDRDSLSALTEEVAGKKPSRALLDTLSDITGGNPFYLGEVMRSLQKGDGLEERIDLKRDAIPVPASVTSLLRGRISDLSSTTIEVIEVAASIGQRFDQHLLEAATGSTPADVSRALHEAAEHGVIVPDPVTGTYSFEHALLREAVYASLSLEQRRVIHSAIARSLERRDDAEERVAELAHHYLAASEEGTDQSTAFRYCLEAARRARSVLAYEQAADFFEKAIERLPSGTQRPERIGLLCDAAEMLIYGGHATSGRERAAEAGELARVERDADQMARAALIYGIPPVEGGIVDRTCVRLLRDALEAMPPDPTPTKARVLARLAQELFFSTDPDDADSTEKLSAEAEKIMRSYGASRDKALVLRARFPSVVGPGRSDQTFALADEILAIGEETRDPETQMIGRIRRATAFFCLGKVVELGHELEACSELAALLKRPDYESIVLVAKACIAVMQESEEAAQSAIEEAYRVGRDIPNAMGAYMLQQAVASYESGSWEHLEPMARMVIEQRPGIRRGWRGALISSLMDQGRPSEAIALMREAVQELPETPRDFMFMASYTFVARCMLSTGYSEGAADIYDALIPFREEHVLQMMTGPVAYMGAVSFTLGVLATVLERWDEAEEHYQDALDRHASLGAVSYVSRTQLEFARMLVRRGSSEDHDRARALLEEACSTAERFGQTRILNEAAEVEAGIDPTGTPVGTAAPTSPTSAALTEQGDFVSFAYGSELAQLKMSRGVEWLARLVINPDVEIHVLDLVGGAPPTTKKPFDDQLTVEAGDAGVPLLDAAAKAAYRKKIEELQEEIDEADAYNDPGRASSAREEMQILLDQLSGAVGLGGRDRKASSNAERARVNVRKRISSTIDKIEEAAPELGRHLRATVKTGTFVSYSSELQATLKWDVKVFNK